MTIDFDPKLLREACLLALRVAAEGELADPRIPSPSLIRPILGFSRLSAAAYGRLRQAVDEDDGFRSRVADAADEAAVGRAGFLWLTRPDGWREDPAFAESPVAGSTRGGQGRKRSGTDDRLARAREKAAEADEARRRAQAQRDGLAADLERVRAELAAAEARVADLEQERNAAVRTQKAVETELSVLRRDLKLARAATREAEEELAVVRSGDATALPSARPAPIGSSPASPVPSPEVPPPEIDVERSPDQASVPDERSPERDGDRDAVPATRMDGRAARAAVRAAAGAAAELARALADAADALGGDSSGVIGSGGVGSAGGSSGGGVLPTHASTSGDATSADLGSGDLGHGDVGRGRPAGDGAPIRGTGPRRVGGGTRRRGGAGRDGTGPGAGAARGRSTGRPKRRQVALPPGVFDDSPEARRRLVSDPSVHVVVDGYNLAREAWSGLEPEEERRRTVALLEETSMRSGAPVTVVFDGDDSAVAPAASRVVRVVFSATGVTADEDIAEMVSAIPLDRPVLVVSSDRAVADDVRGNGATVLSSAEYLAAIGR